MGLDTLTFDLSIMRSLEVLQVSFFVCVCVCVCVRALRHVPLSVFPLLPSPPSTSPPSAPYPSPPLLTPPLHPLCALTAGLSGYPAAARQDQPPWSTNWVRGPTIHQSFKGMCTCTKYNVLCVNTWKSWISTVYLRESQQCNWCSYMCLYSLSLSIGVSVHTLEHTTQMVYQR